MNCKEYLEQIPSYIHKELDGEKRIFLKKHLKACVNCREAYLLQVKIYYTLNREEILIPAPETSTEFSREVIELIQHSSKRKKLINSHWIWYTAAAILLIGIVIGRFFLPDKTKIISVSNTSDTTLSQLIASENWSRLEIVISDQEEFNRYSADTVPIYILLDKLSNLQKMGIQTLLISYPTDPDLTKEITTIPNNPKIQLSLNDFIRLLEQVKQQRSQITLNEFSKLLTKL